MTDAIAGINQNSLWKVIVWLIMWYKASVRKEEVNNNNERIYIDATEINWKNKWCNHKPHSLPTETVSHYPNLYGK